MLRSIAAVLTLALAPLLAQDGPPTFVPKAKQLISLRIDGVDTLLEQSRTTTLGRLLAEPEVADAVARAAANLRQQIAQRDAVRSAAASLNLELPHWMVASLPSAYDFSTVERFEVAELLRLEVTSTLADNDDFASNTLIVACRPQVEGRWTADFEGEMQQRAREPWLRTVPNAKVDGYAAHMFAPKLGEQEPAQPDRQSLQSWMLHLPGTFVFGEGEPKDSGSVRPAPAAPPPGLSMTMDLELHKAMFGRFGGPPPEFRAFGLDTLRTLQWRVRFAGELVLDELEIVFDGSPKGLFGGVLTGTATPPTQALPDGAIAQLRCSLDLRLLLAALPAAFGDGFALPEGFQAQLVAAFTGGVALGVAAPAGGLLPRLFVSLGVADEAMVDRVLALPWPSKDATYEGLPCTILQIPGLPQGMQPTLCRRPGVVHIAESARSMRAFLKAQQNGSEAMDVGDVPLPEGAGDIVAGFDLRCDEAALYRAFRDVWLPLYALVDPSPTAVLGIADMPSSSVVAEHLGKSRGVLRRDGDRYVVQHLGALGGPEFAALLMTWGPILSGPMNRDYTTRQLAQQIAEHKLRQVWSALEAYQQANRRWPNDLAELFAAAHLAPDALLMPGDATAEAVELANGKTARSSFRYFPVPVEVEPQGGTMLLVEITPRQGERSMLTADGSVATARYMQSIDGLGK